MKLKYTLVERDIIRVIILAQEHNVVPQAGPESREFDP